MTNRQIDSMQVVRQAFTGALAFSVLSSALGIMIGAAGAMPLSLGIPVTTKGIDDLKLVYGVGVVSKAVGDVGTDDILLLAATVEDYYVHEMRKKYGDYATDTALATAIPGDVRGANEIAAALKAKGVTAASTPEEKQQAVGEGKHKAARTAQPVKDTKTGIVYHSKASAGMAVAADYGLPAVKPDGKPNSFVWYEVIKRDPTRFVRAGELAVSEQAPPAATPFTETKLDLVRRLLPEYSQVLKEWDNKKPRKFIEQLEVIVAPASFVPSAQGDYAYTMSFDWNGRDLTKGPSYSYDTMMTTIKSPYEREVDVPFGHRVWITTYDGQWGGHWSRVHVYVHKDDPATIKLLPG